MQLPRVLGFPKSSGPQECLCGHATEAHEHYRRGSDCALCECARYKATAAKPHDELGARREQARARAA